MSRPFVFALGILLGTLGAISSLYLYQVQQNVINSAKSKLGHYVGPGISVEFREPHFDLLSRSLHVSHIGLRNRSSGELLASASSVSVTQSANGTLSVSALTASLQLGKRLNIQGESLVIDQLSADTGRVALGSVDVRLVDPIDVHLDGAEISVTAVGGSNEAPLVVSINTSRLEGQQIIPVMGLKAHVDIQRLAPNVYLHPSDLFLGRLARLDISVSQSGLHDRLWWALLAGDRADPGSIAFFPSERQATLDALSIDAATQQSISAFYDGPGTLSLTLAPHENVSMSSLFNELGRHALIERGSLSSSFISSERYSIQ